jgi:hypothetical protein
MRTIIHKANSRGQTKTDWLDSKHNFSFASYHDRERIHFGALRVVNDDIVEPGMGFGKHPHDNMEIISIPLKGKLAHRDSMNHQQTIGENEVQVMSAGTGLFHSEFNASQTEIVNFLQIWIYPDKKNVNPVYDQKYFDPKLAINQWQLLVSGMERENPEILHINQKASISRSFLQKDNVLKYVKNQTNYGSFLFVISGEIEMNNIRFSERDAVGVCEANELTVKALSDSWILNIEIPELNYN